MDYKSKTAIYLRKSRSDEVSESVEETLSYHIYKSSNNRHF